MELALKLTSYLAVFSLGCLAMRFISRLQFLKQKKVVQRYERVVQAKESQLVGLLHSIHHDGFNPRLKRIRGCINVSKTHFESIEQLEEFATRPNHQHYIKLICKELKELRQWFNTITTECLEMENDILENAKKYQ